jgi:hypothetical protein
MTTTYEVKDGARTLQFNGKLLGESSSRNRQSERWIEFKLYRTESGSYVLSRVGASLTFHEGGCFLVEKYKLSDVLVTDLDPAAVGCQECEPTLEAPIVYPEKFRYWAQVSEEPEAVLEALYKYDRGGTRYLTNVAQRLLEQAADRDPSVEAVYRVEHIP